MPKTTWFSRPSQRHDAIVALISGKVACRNAHANKQKEKITKCDLAKSAGISLHTLDRREKDPGEFTVAELIGIGRALDIPIEELRACIRY